MRDCLKTLLLFFCPLCLFAQQLTFTPAFRNYSTDQGLPNNWIFGILQDQAGYIWVSTHHGVCRFNGYEFEQFPDTLSANYSSVMSCAMAEDAQGRMWYVDFDGRVFCVENGIVHPYRHNSVIAAQKPFFDFMHSLLVSENGDEFWLFANNYGVLHLWGEGKWERIVPPQGVSTHIFEQGGKWARNNFPVGSEPLPRYLPGIAFQNESGVIVVDSLLWPGEKWSFYEFAQKLRNGNWLFFLRGFLYCLHNDRLLWMRPYALHPNCLLEDRNGAIFIGNLENKGLEKYRSLDDLRTSDIEAAYFSGLSVSAVMQDREGGYWIGTQQEGIFYCPTWDGGAVVETPLLEGQNVQSIVTDGENRLYTGLLNGQIFQISLSENRMRNISPPKMKTLKGLSYDEKSKTLSVTGGMTDFYQNDSWGNASGILEPGSGTKGNGGGVTYKSPGNKANIWFGADMVGLWHIDLEKKVVVDATWWGFKRAVRFYSVGQASDGRVWASRYDGLFEWHGDTVLRRPEFEHPAFLQNSPDIQYLSDGSLVLCPKGFGVIVWKPGTTQVFQISQKEGLLSNKVDALHIAPGDVVWACTQKGLSKLTPQGNGRYRVDNFTVKHGLPSNSVNDVTTLGDDVWAATAKGLFRLKDKPFATTIPAPFFPKITVNNTPYPANRPLILPHDSTDVSIEYLSLHYRSGGAIPYRFRLRTQLGDTTWRYTARRSVFFSNLAPGVYRIEVQAQNEDGLWSILSVLPVIIRPPWWQTWWARSLGLGLLGSVAVGVYKWRVGQVRHDAEVKTQMHRLEQSALQAQMNPHFIFNCLNSIQQFILSNEKEEAARFLSKFAALVRDTLNASVNGKVALEDEMRMLDNYLQLERLRFQGKFDYEIRVDENLDIFDITLPPIVVQPFVENAILHGLKGKETGGKIQVEFFSQNDLLCVRITDNGSGLQPNTAHPNGHLRPSLGISRTQKRFALLREKYKSQAIDFEYSTDQSTAGTEVLLKLPLSAAASGSDDSNSDFPKVYNFRKV